MRTIVIRPEIIGFDNTGVKETRRPLPRFAVAVMIPLVALGGWAIGHSGKSTVAAPVVVNTPAQKSVALPPPEAAAPLAEVPLDGAVDLQLAVDQRLITAELIGNGREQMQATLFNRHGKRLTVKVGFGQMFESGANLVVAARGAAVEVPPGQSATLYVRTVATRSTNRVNAARFQLSTKTAPKLDLLLSYAEDHPELSMGALQTAVLALTDNLPLSAVCKFTPAGADLPSRFDTTAFRAETGDILTALSTLREIGVREREVAMTVDPQLKLEAMIEPLLRAPAMRYYGIAADKEWDFWKGELLSGESGTRHYALFGIARFYPEIAIEMLPKWAREKRTNVSFRLAAVQALADTKKREALPILHDLVGELGRNTELGRAAMDAAQYLDSELVKTAAAADTISFRSTVATTAL